MRLLVAASTAVALLAVGVPAAGAKTKDGVYKGDSPLGAVTFVVHDEEVHGFTGPHVQPPFSAAIEPDGDFRHRTGQFEIGSGTIKPDGSASGDVHWYEARGKTHRYTWKAELVRSGDNGAPKQGDYEGEDQNHTKITFTVDGDEVVHFKAKGKERFSDVPIVGRAFEKPGHTGVAAQWTRDDYVRGSWWDGGEGSLFQAELNP
jgi:hypothetical protein